MRVASAEWQSKCRLEMFTSLPTEATVDAFRVRMYRNRRKAKRAIHDLMGFGWKVQPSPGGRKIRIMAVMRKETNDQGKTRNVKEIWRYVVFFRD